MDNITLLAIRTIALLSFYPREKVIAELIEIEGPLVTVLVIDHISQSQGGPALTPEILAKAMTCEVIGALTPDPETKLDPNLN